MTPIPTVSVDSGTVSGLVGQTVTNTGEWSVPSGDNWTLTAMVDGVPASGPTVDTTDGTWSWTSPPGASAGTQTVTITTTDTTTDPNTSVWQTFEVDWLPVTATTVSIVSPTAVAVGTPLTLYATVSADDPTQATPTGSVQFFDGSTSLGTGSLSSAGVASLPLSGLSAGSHTITATYTGSGGESLDTSTASRQITASTAPTEQTAEADGYASSYTVSSTSVNLSIADTDAGVTYSWAATPETAGAAEPTFSVNDSSTAYDPTATFSQAGAYLFTATIANAQGLAATSQVTVTVNQEPTSIVLSPALVSVPAGGTQTMAAIEEDQFGNAMTLPAFTWNAVGGTINSAGDFTAASAPGSALITATVGALNGSETVSIVPASLDGIGRPTVSADMPYTLKLSDPTGALTGGSIDWGDETSSPITSGAAALTHVYALAGPYSISAHLSNGDPITIDSGAAGTADTNFNFSSQGSGATGCQPMAVQPDGQVVVCDQASGSAVVARYTSSGTWETTFPSSPLNVAQAVAIQPVGDQSDIVVAGQETVGGVPQFAMVRYLSDGSLDSTGFDAKFNAAVSPFPGESFTPERLAVQADGQIVVAGYVASQSGTDLGVACYNQNGSLDTGFGCGGGATAGLSVDTTDPCGLALGSDGSIVLAGTVITPQIDGSNQYSFAVVRFASDGTLDTSFNQSGEATDDWGDHFNHATSLAIQSDGGIVVAGYDASVSGDSVDIVRFLPNGLLDPNFGSGGQVETGQPAGAAYSVVIQANNVILVGGAVAEAGRMDFGLARFDVNGQIDDNFNSDGVVTQDVGGDSDSAVTELAIQPDGDILAAGVSGALPGGTLTAAAVDRYFAADVAGARVRVDDYGLHDLPLSGDASVPANTPYTLTLGDGTTDLGSASNISYIVNWGDGNWDPPISAENLAAQNDQMTHTYTIATTGITVDLEVGNTTYPNVGSEPVSVDFSDVTTTQLAVGNPYPSFGDSVTLTATVTPSVPATGTPRGTVEFYDGTIDLGPATLALNGSYDQATLNTPPLTAGTHSFTAVYGGDGTFDGSTSPPATASVDSDAQGALTISASEVEGEGAEYALALPPTAGGEGITQWTIYWGDGTFTSINSTTQTQAQMETQTHTFANGSYTITAIAASSAGNFSASTSVSLDLANHVAQGLSVSTSAANYSGYDTLDGGGAGVEISGSFSDPGALESHTVTIDWGDGSDPVSLPLDPGETTFDYPAPQYASTGTYTVSVSVADDAGSTSPYTVALNYSNVAPSGLALNLDQSTINIGDQVNLSGSFTDPQTNIAHTVTIDWGDGVGSPELTTLSLGPGETTFQAEPQTYTTAGNFTVHVTISGIDGSTTTATPVTVNAILPQVTIGADVPVALETGAQGGEFLVTRSGDTTGTLRVYYQVSGTAVNGQDYQTILNYVDIPAHDASAPIDISPNDMHLTSGATSVVITLSPSAAYQVVTAYSGARVTIDENDPPSVGSSDTDGLADGGLILYGSDGTPAGSQETALDGDLIRMEMVVNPDGASSGTFTLAYDPTQIVVSFDQAGSDMINPTGVEGVDATEFTLTAASPQLVYVQQVQHSGDLQYSADSGITISQVPGTYDESNSGSSGDPGPLGLAAAPGCVGATFVGIRLKRTNAKSGVVDITNDEGGDDSAAARNVLVGEQINLSVTGAPLFTRLYDRIYG